MKNDQKTQDNFLGLGIAPGLLKRIDALGFKNPTPIQIKAIPIATSGEDLVGIAQTGSGKTLAFAIPMLQHIAATKKIGLILLPTRELAVQVDESVRNLGRGSGLKTALLIGGTSPVFQRKQLLAKPHIIIATPGRLLDHMSQRNASLAKVGMLVLDEADRMLDMGFAPQLKKILDAVPHERQTMLFSATMPDQIASIARQYMHNPLRVEMARQGTTAENIDQEVFIVPREKKMELLERLLKEYKGPVLIFSRTKHGAKKIAQTLRQKGHSADELHSNRSQNQRQAALKGFSNGRYRILVATDIASRGIHVTGIELVINFDLPEQIEDYVHRIGRTGRAGRAGKAITFAAPEQKRDVQQIEKLIKLILPIKSETGESLAPLNESMPPRKTSHRHFSGNRRRRGGAPRRGRR